MTLLKTLPLLIASLFLLPAKADGVGRMDNSSQKAIAADLKTCDKPVWPPEALRKELQGRVTLAYLVGMDGKVLESRVEKSSGHAMLDLAAQDGLAKCQFTLPESVGRTEPTWTRMQYVWTLEKPKTPEQQAAELAKIQAQAAGGDAAAMYRLSSYYMMGTAGLARDPVEGVRLLRQSAELGHAPAQGALGFLLMSGKHVAANAEEAIQWTEKAALQGDARAQVGLATMLLEGHGVAKDTARARAMLEKAAAQDNVMAKSFLASWLIREGEPEAGLKLLEEAVAKHDRFAQFALAQVLEKGELLPQDKSRAEALYQRAEAAGFGPAKAALQKLRQQGAN